eukprot:TRINITY_DN973_c0_g1_i1.p1 TRINITY_DN973_c0_g1~~TRINITY_DN973_c0_g1_i1.p1  ORF type:complete len:189 (-),score=29.26 TRINITY_DN973_c0_g1_i1:292-819(-)
MTDFAQSTTVPFIGVAPEFLTKLKPKIKDDINSAIDFVKRVFWKLWVKHLSQIRAPTSSIEDNCKQYVRAGNKANDTLRELINIDALDGCRVKDLEAMVVSKQILIEMLSKVASVDTSAANIVLVKSKPVPLKRRMTVKDAAIKKAKLRQNQPLTYIHLNFVQKSEAKPVKVLHI